MPRIAVFGAGAIGCWVGGRLASGGADVALIGRPRVLDELADGLRVTELAGAPRTARPTLATDARAAAGCEIVAVTVKSAQTAAAARELAAVLPERAVVISLQNGVRNPGVLQAGLPGRRVLAGMVPFNVIRAGVAHYHRGTSGTLMVERHDAIAPLAEACRRAELACELRDDMPAVLWTKLVMNLNNAINALAGVPLRDELADRDFRRCLSHLQREALDLLAAANQPTVRMFGLPPRVIARVLPMPDWLFRVVANRFASTDPHARSSMWDDLEAGRPTEIDYLQGEVVALAERHGKAAPRNAAIVRLVRDAERGGKRDWKGTELAAYFAAITPPTA
jgi:2-dehydropantoate 2-reductase